MDGLIGGIVTRAGPLTDTNIEPTDQEALSRLNLRPVFVGVEHELIRAAIDAEPGRICTTGSCWRLDHSTRPRAAHERWHLKQWSRKTTIIENCPTDLAGGIGAENMNAHETDLSNEAAALADILKWSVDLPAWQRDALRRLCGQSKLEAADINGLVAVCKGTEKGSPLDATHVRDPAASHAVVSPGALHSLSHVNALAPGERLTFGKSGYARVLKQLCRARSPKGDAILPNIYATGSGTPAASVDFYIGAQKRSASWAHPRHGVPASAR